MRHRTSTSWLPPRLIADGSVYRAVRALKNKRVETRQSVRSQHASVLFHTFGTCHWARKDSNSCEPLDVLKHLTSDYLKKKLGT